MVTYYAITITTDNGFPSDWSFTSYQNHLINRGSIHLSKYNCWKKAGNCWKTLKRNVVALVFCTVVFCAIVTSFPLGKVSHVVLVCFTVRQKVVSRRIYGKFTALNLLYFKVSYRQRYFARPIHGNVRWKRSALKTKKLTKRLKIKPVLFSRLIDLLGRVVQSLIKVTQG